MRKQIRAPHFFAYQKKMRIHFMAFKEEDEKGLFLLLIGINGSRPQYSV